MRGWNSLSIIWNNDPSIAKSNASTYTINSASDFGCAKSVASAITFLQVQKSCSAWVVHSITLLSFFQVPFKSSLRAIWCWATLAAVSCMVLGADFLFVVEAGSHDTSDPESRRNFRLVLRSKIWRQPDCGAIETSTAVILASIAD
ncbi:hypothetical protein NPIL_504521 [Nephila pilipes]|uniref:Uncharacterized protein n=1 Tax=Nephila pilipes TaxID=299642 RepID=A0A8X6U8Y5_NEPPI|nr:hypothetical protein NPIL_504521 [Nephila pilipes]